MDAFWRKIEQRKITQEDTQTVTRRLLELRRQRRIPNVWNEAGVWIVGEGIIGYDRLLRLLDLIPQLYELAAAGLATVELEPVYQTSWLIDGAAIPTTPESLELAIRRAVRKPPASEGGRVELAKVAR